MEIPGSRFSLQEVSLWRERERERRNELIIRKFI
jgi:hypothetical protein